MRKPGTKFPPPASNPVPSSSVVLLLTLFSPPLLPLSSVTRSITMRPFTSTLRPAVRQMAGRRFASTNTEAAQKKAQDALSGVQKNAEQIWASAKKFLGPVGEKAGNMLGCESQQFQP